MSKYTINTNICLLNDTSIPSGLYKVTASGEYKVDHAYEVHQCSLLYRNQVSVNEINTYFLKDYNQRDKLFLNVHSDLDQYLTEINEYLIQQHHITIRNSDRGIVVTPTVDIDALIDNGFNLSQNCLRNGRYITTTIVMPTVLKDNKNIMKLIADNCKGYNATSNSQFGEVFIDVAEPTPELANLLRSYNGGISSWVHYNPLSVQLPIMRAYGVFSKELVIV